MRHRQECRCGSVVDVEDDDRDQIRADVGLWRANHRCMPKDERDEGRVGMGFAAAHQTEHRDIPRGHINLEVNA